MIYPYYIGCSQIPSASADGTSNQCLTAQSVQLTQQQVSEQFPAPLTFSQANYAGSLVFFTWGLIWVAKQKANLFKGNFFTR